VEQLKHNQNDFGGFQTKRMTTQEAEQRMCARLWCGNKGLLQLSIPFEDPRMYRVLCATHFILVMVVAAAAMGDPSPIGEGRRIAEALGVDWNPQDSLKIQQVVDLENAICSRCGGQMMLESVGDYKAIRWSHTCKPQEVSPS